MMKPSFTNFLMFCPAIGHFRRVVRQINNGAAPTRMHNGRKKLTDLMVLLATSTKDDSFPYQFFFKKKNQRER